MAQPGERAPRDAWVLRVLGFDPTKATNGSGLKPALERWAQSRAAVIGQLKQLETAIRAMNDPLADEAIILVKAISANLTAAPDSKRAVAELRRYLETDSIIDDAELENGFGITVRIRDPLIPALDALDRAMVA